MTDSGPDPAFAASPSSLSSQSRPSGLQSGVGLLRERVRDFIYDCTKDECGHGWTLSAQQADDLIAMVRDQ